MATKAQHGAKEFIRSFRTYEKLLNSVGLEADPEAVAGHIGSGPEEAEAIVAAIERGEGDLGTEIAESMAALVQSLCDRLTGADERFSKIGGLSPEEMAGRLGDGGAEDRYLLADAVLLNGHRPFLREQYISVADFRALVEARDDADKLAQVKLVPFLREELGRRGFRLTLEQVDALFEGADEDMQVPACVEHIMRLVDESFAAGLIPLEDMVGDRDPDVWLEEARQRLLFRSHSAMHKAVAEATSLKYDCVHKALSGKKKAKRIQAEIKYCLVRWLTACEEGREPDINPDYRGVPIDETCKLMEDLEKRFPTKEQIYRTISEHTGIKSGSVRRYFQDCGQLKYAPLTVYQCAKGMLSGAVAVSAQRTRSASKSSRGRRSSKRRERATRRSYLADSRTRKVAFNLSDRLSVTLEQLRNGEDDPELEVEFMETRRRLIATMKEQRRLAANS